MKTEEFRRTHERLEELLAELHGACAGDGSGRAHALLKELRSCVAADWKKAGDTVSVLVRTQVALGLAPLFLAQKQPYRDHPELSAMVQNGLLHPSAFIQKSPYHLRFYRRLLAGLEQPARSVLEIGVKGGGSTALWKVLFPAATVVGLDIKLRLPGGPEPAADGVIYLQGDQTDVKRLQEVADRYGPFDLAIDDGSHVTDHQAITMRALLPHVRPGGFYVVEDIHASVKAASTRDVGFGEDIWADFTATALQRLRGGPYERTAAGAQLAAHLARWIDELIIARELLAVRVKDKGEAGGRV